MKIRLHPHRHCGGFIHESFMPWREDEGERQRPTTTTTTTAPVNVGAEGGSLSVGGKFVEGPDLSGAQNVTYTEIDPGAFQLAEKVTSDLTKFVTASNDAATVRQKSLDEMLRGVFDKLAEKDTEEKTGFASLLISPLFWIMMAGLSLVGLFIWRRV